MERIGFKHALALLIPIAISIFLFGDEDCDSCYSIEAFGFKLVVIGLVFIGAAFYFSRKWFDADSLLYCIQRQPVNAIAMITSEIPTALQGIIKCASPLVSPLTKTTCVFYHYIKEQYVPGENGHWEIIQNQSNNTEFLVDDKTGTIAVNLRNVDSDLSKFKLAKKPVNGLLDFSNSEVDAAKTVFRRPLEETKKFLFFSSKVKFRESEFVLRVGEPVFVCGWVYRENGKKIVAEEKNHPLIVSRKTKEGFLDDFVVGDEFFYQNNFLLFFGVGLLGIPLFLAKMADPLVIGIAIALISGKMIVEIFNRMVELRNRLGNAKSQIGIELKKRFDLVPNLEKTVKEYARHEKGLLDAITRLRQPIEVNETGMRKLREQQKELDKALVAVAEKYPKLAASDVFQDFMQRLVQIEENISYYRGFYSKTVLKYNTLIQTIPFNALAKLSGFRSAEYWQIEETQRANPVFKFNEATGLNA